MWCLLEALVLFLLNYFHWSAPRVLRLFSPWMKDFPFLCWIAWAFCQSNSPDIQGTSGWQHNPLRHQPSFPVPHHQQPCWGYPLLHHPDHQGRCWTGLDPGLSPGYTTTYWPPAGLRAADHHFLVSAIQLSTGCLLIISISFSMRIRQTVSKALLKLR